MTPLQTTARILRDSAAAVEITSAMRSRWTQRLRELFANRWTTPAANMDVRISRRVHVGGGGRMLRALVRDTERMCGVRLKWCPAADPAALTDTLANLNWWRTAFPQLAHAAPETFDAWTDERVLVIEERPGHPLGEHDGPLDVVHRLARWMHAYAYSPAPDDLEAGPRRGSAVSRTPGGSWTVDAHTLLSSRIADADAAADDLARHGFPAAQRWRTRFDLDGLMSATRFHAAGFVHGDFKPGNVLVTHAEFALVDWWAAPRMSWPLTDIATFAGNLWLMNTPLARRIWAIFVRAYYPTGMDDLSRRTLDLVSTMMCLGYLARRARHPACHLLERRRCSQMVQRLVGAATCIGRENGAVGA